jgi:hypothetical protein
MGAKQLPESSRSRVCVRALWKPALSGVRSRPSRGENVAAARRVAGDTVSWERKAGAAKSHRVGGMEGTSLRGHRYPDSTSSDLAANCFGKTLTYAPGKTGESAFKLPIRRRWDGALLPVPGEFQTS